MAHLNVELVAADRKIWSGEATMVVAPAADGEIGILPGHEPVLGQLVEGGVVRVRTTDGGLVTAAVHGGFLSVTGTGVSIIAEDADLADEIDVNAARSALQDADDAERARAVARVRAVEQSA